MAWHYTWKNPKGTTRKLLINEFSKVKDTQLTHRNLLNSYILRKKDQKENKETIPIYYGKCKTRKKYLGLMFPRRQNICTQKTLRYHERNQRWQKQMEWCIMFLDQKNRYCENDHSTQKHPQIQCNPHRTSNGLFPVN